MIESSEKTKNIAKTVFEELKIYEAKLVEEDNVNFEVELNGKIKWTPKREKITKIKKETLGFAIFKVFFIECDTKKIPGYLIKIYLATQLLASKTKSLILIFSRANDKQRNHFIFIE